MLWYNNAVLENIVAKDWATALSSEEEHLHKMGDFLRSEAAAGRGYLPASKDILRAFQTPCSDVKVLIVGQDPYPTPGHPVGLSFSVNPGVNPLPRSLQNIFTELHADIGVPVPKNGDLLKWTRQGVMLLNRVLTVQPNKPGSHKDKGWERITETAIKHLVSREQPLVAILWGNQARGLKPILESSNVDIIESSHPSPFSAHSGFFGSRPFSRTNQFLENRKVATIDWDLTEDD
ncbi:MAG: uracil-DNA glycosylase [Candidatus Ancillula sp.]|nr:uracil-DNA glycosylase [Candidatus Ancillula sp.]